LQFIVPDQFLRNAPDVLAMGEPADLGLKLIDYMCRRLGLASLDGLDVLDFGCGTRFADSIMNRHVPLRSYTGIDVNAPMVRFLSRHATDPRLSFHVLDARNPMYNPGGQPLSADSVLPLAGRSFDVICMFSVITHQQPDDARAIFTLLRRHVRPGGKLFFSCFIDDTATDTYVEGTPEHPTLHSFYADAYMRRLLAETGWRVESFAVAGPEDLPIMDSFGCVPG
jgi:SAM-dependent methyltransferase